MNEQKGDTKVTKPKPAAEAGDVQVSPPLFPRMAALVVLLAAVDLWATHQFGIGVKDPVWTAGILASLTSAFGLMSWFVEKNEKADAAKKIRGVLRLIFSLPILVTLYVVFFILVLNWSSIVVVAESGILPPMKLVTGQDLDETVEEETEELDAVSIRFPVRVTALGSLFSVRVDGYLPMTVEVKPLLGATVVVERDLVPTPALLVRPSLLVLGSIRGGGSLRLWRVDIKPEELLVEVPGSQDAGAFLMSHKRRLRVSAGMRNDWRMELIAARNDPATISKLLLAWSRPQFVTLKEPLRPGMELRADIFSRANSLVASADVYLDEVPLVDLPVLEAK